MSYGYFKPSKPKASPDGIKARSQRGNFASNWWAQRWIAALERLMDSGRLSRGRSYARKGQVLDIDEVKSGIAARVQGSRPTPYKISIQLAALSDAQWDKVIDALAEQAIFTAQLLAGEMPQEIEQTFQAAGVSLFPSTQKDLKTDCSCPDPANPCKHIAATYYILGERFDEDPFLLFRLRGRSQEQVLQALRQRRAGKGEMEEAEAEESETIIPLEDCLGNFWGLGAPLEEFSLSIRPPALEMPLLKRLGEPSFAPDAGLAALLKNAYQAFSQQAIQVAYQEKNKESADGS